MFGLFRRKTRPAPVIRRQRSSRWEAHSAADHDRRVRVVGKQPLTADAVQITLEAVDGREFDFEPGQYLTHCFTIDGEAVRRAYSLCSLPGAQARFAVKRIAGGRASRYVCDTLAVGDEYAVRGPTGSFVLDPAESGRPLALIAGGSGITPCLSLVRSALAADPGRRVDLLFANHDEAAVMFAEDLAALEAEFDGLTVTHALSAVDGQRVDAGAVSGWLPDREAVCYLCGPSGLMEAARRGLRHAGVPQSRIRSEAFVSSHGADRPRPSEPIVVRFTRSGIDAVQQPGQSILDAGLEAGVDLPFSCTVGGCAACKQTWTAGELVQEEPNCLSESEKSRHEFLACCAFATAALEVEA